MISYFMTEMSQEGSPGLHLLYELKGLFDGEVGEVLTMTQRIDNQDIKIKQFLALALVDALGIGDIGKVADTIAIDG